MGEAIGVGPTAGDSGTGLGSLCPMAASGGARVWCVSTASDLEDDRRDEAPGLVKLRAVDERRMSEPMRERTDLPGVVLEPASDKDMLVRSVEKYR